jgi:flagellar biosynthesis/type III secretory pathway M-ring protein FliF/YscJ
MNKKYIPVILMLIGGLVTVVITFVNHYSILAKLMWLLAVMAVLYFVGTIVINVIERFEAANQKKLEEEEKARLEAQEQALREEGTVEEKDDVSGDTAT